MSANGSSRLLRWVRQARRFPKLPGEARRPAIFVLLFWSCWVTSYASHAFGLFDAAPRFGLAPVTLAFAAVALVWVALPWDPRADRRGWLAAPAFLLAVFAAGYLTDLNLSILFYAVVVADGVFLFGFGRGTAYAACAALPVFFTNVLLVDGAAMALAATAIAVPFAVFVIGTCAAVVEAVEGREQGQALLSELESADAELGRAYAELEDHAARVRELSVSEERARMAREMHDSVGHYLTVLNVQLEAAVMKMEKRPEEARERVEKAKGLASEALSEVRCSVRALRSLAAAEGSGALEALVRNLDGAGPSVSFAVIGEERALEQGAELVLYRALQEGLTNASRHANARRVFAKLAYGPRSVRLEVADDGEGAPEGAFEGGFGLGALEERVGSLGGSFRAGNAPEGGFRLEVELPAQAPRMKAPSGRPRAEA